jgi:hypothetical protein
MDTATVYYSIGHRTYPPQNTRTAVSIESVTTWINQTSTQDAFRAMLPSVPIALAILFHAILTRTRRVANKTATPTKRSEARIR